MTSGNMPGGSQRNIFLRVVHDTLRFGINAVTITGSIGTCCTCCTITIFSGPSGCGWWWWGITSMDPKPDHMYPRFGGTSVLGMGPPNYPHTLFFQNLLGPFKYFIVIRDSLRIYMPCHLP